MSKKQTIGNLEKKYGVDFGVRPDMKLETYLKKEGVPSLSKAVKKLKVDMKK